MPRKRTVYLKKSKTVQKRPPRTKADNFCLTAYVTINGQQAFTLFDSGCTTDTCSPDFARVANLTVFPIESAITLQLGTVGSRSQINYGMNAQVKYGPIDSEEYMDIVNLDRFDMIIGTKFMRKHGICLDFAKNEIRVRGKQFRVAIDQQIKELAAGTMQYVSEDIPTLRERWLELNRDIMSGVPEKMPPMRAVNHRIPLIDEKKVYNYHLPRCPDAMKEQLIDKINKYVRAGWWEAVQTNQAAPMLCIPK
ncbi:hypothetical protein K438DRAFT_1614254, partial [Mycena galopus ATCC 62051]